MLGIGCADVIATTLALVLTASALLGYRINQRCKDHRVWWTHVDGIVMQRQSARLSTPASTLGLVLFSISLGGLFIDALKLALMHHVAASFIFLTLWLPLVVGLLTVVCLPVVLIARWSAGAVAGLKNAR